MRLRQEFRFSRAYSADQKMTITLAQCVLENMWEDLSQAIAKHLSQIENPALLTIKAEITLEHKLEHQ